MCTNPDILLHTENKAEAHILCALTADNNCPFGPSFIENGSHSKQYLWSGLKAFLVL